MKRMMTSAGKKRLIPENLFVKQGIHCVNVTLAKIFVPDVSKVMHHTASITMNYSGDCYDQAAHAIQSVSLRAHGVPKPAVKMMLLFLETVQFCLRTGFGESTESFGSSLENPTLGLGMGNGACPLAFAVHSTLAVNAYKIMRYGAKLTSTYMAILFLLAAVTYVDDTNLLHMEKISNSL